jgi:UDP-2,4-diacetamido-2,4,6-trideoxy-beta-L-altropyranose hydrolase
VKVVFRADSSFEMGMGHLMRCLTLAAALREQGARCRFVCRDHPGALLEQVRARGFELQVLPLETDRVDSSRTGGPAHRTWVGGAAREDAESTLRVIEEEAADWVVVDHYGLDAEWESVVRRPGCRLLVIDDLADRAHACDVLLDQTPGRTVEDYAPHVSPDTELLLGEAYALLRPEFQALREAAFERRGGGRVERVLISMGGSDPKGVTAQVLDALETLPSRLSFRVTAVMNSRSPALDAVRERAAHATRETSVLCDVGDMASLMVETDLAIGGAGTTSWERCCLGLPSILVVLADNQRLIADQLEQLGAAVIIRECPSAEEFGRSLAGEIAALQSSPDKLAQLSRAASAVTDGSGTQRLIARMEHE